MTVMCLCLLLPVKRKASVQTGVKIFWWVTPKNKEWWQMLCRTCSCSYLLYTAVYWCDINHNEAKLHVLRRCLSILHIVHLMTEHKLNIVGVNWTQCTLYGMFRYSINISILYFSLSKTIWSLLHPSHISGLSGFSWSKRTLVEFRDNDVH